MRCHVLYLRRMATTSTLPAKIYELYNSGYITQDQYDMLRLALKSGCKVWGDTMQNPKGGYAIKFEVVLMKVVE